MSLSWIEDYYYGIGDIYSKKFGTHKMYEVEFRPKTKRVQQENKR